jgi:hypothetical protein
MLDAVRKAGLFLNIFAFNAALPRASLRFFPRAERKRPCVIALGNCDNESAVLQLSWPF